MVGQNAPLKQAYEQQRPVRDAAPTPWTFLGNASAVGTKVEATLFIGDDNCVSAYDRPSRPNDIMKRPHLRSGG